MSTQFELILRKEVEKINIEAALNQAKASLRESQALLKEAFDLLENHGFKKEAQEVIELTRKIGKVMGRL
ncbi:MAG: hypothetical protein ABGX12_06475 [Desulfurobacteriaceae bacterium]